jgi:hypothetical protein
LLLLSYRYFRRILLCSASPGSGSPFSRSWCELTDLSHTCCWPITWHLCLALVNYNAVLLYGGLPVRYLGLSSSLRLNDSGCNLPKESDARGILIQGQKWNTWKKHIWLPDIVTFEQHYEDLTKIETIIWQVMTADVYMCPTLECNE